MRSRERAAFLDDTQWLGDLGTVTGMVPEDYGPCQSLRVWLDGVEVEFGLVLPSWLDLPLDIGTRRVLADGCRVLHDPGGRLRSALPGHP